MKRLGEGDVRKAGIRIHEKEIFSLGLGRQLVAGPSLACPTGGQGSSRQKSDPGISLGQFPNHDRRAVGGVIIEGKDFEVRVVAFDQGFKTRADSVFLIAGRDEHREERKVGGVCRLSGKAENLQIQQIVKDKEAKKSENTDMKNIHKLAGMFLLRAESSRKANLITY